MSEKSLKRLRPGGRGEAAGHGAGVSGSFGMTFARGSGLYMRRTGETVTCPHCKQTVEKLVPRQITCGGVACRQKQHWERENQRRFKRKV